MFWRVLLKILKSIIFVIGSLVISPIVLLLTLVDLVASAAEAPWNNE